jgi:hypothetical protein
LQFRERGQLFICSHNKASSVLALGGHNPKLSAPCDPNVRYSPNSIRLC